jgi:hypothetical protein
VHVTWKPKYANWQSCWSLQIRIRAKDARSQPFLLIIACVMVFSNYWHRLSVAETILVPDNGGHRYAILHELRFVLAKNSTISWRCCFK